MNARKSINASYSYRCEYRKLIGHVSQALNKKECSHLRYIHSERLAAVAGARWTPTDGGLALFELFEKARITSSDHPERLAEMLRDIGREDKCKDVEIFIEENRSLQVTATDGPYAPSKGVAPRPADLDDNYTFFVRLPIATQGLLPIGDSSSTWSDLGPCCPHVRREPSSDTCSSPTDSPSSSLISDDSSCSTQQSREEEDEDYEPVSAFPGILQSLPSEPKPLVEHTLRLLANPVQQLIQQAPTSQEHSVWSQEILHTVSSSRFKLRILLAEPTSARIAAYLYLLPGSQLRDDIPLHAKLSVKLPCQSGRKVRVKRQSESSSRYIHQSSVLMDIPPSRHRRKKQCLVAQFPHIISHSNFLKDTIIPGPFLELKLIIKVY